MNILSSEKSIAIFGAGKIGRSFIGQLFSNSGFHVIFIDVDERIISELNLRNQYEVVIKSEKEEVIKIKHISGVLASDTDAVIDVVARCSLMATCVGKNALPKILPTVAKGIEKRFEIQSGFPLDIILAENIRDACSLIKDGLTALLPKDFPVDTYLGFIETSIGKMVPIMPKEIEAKDPLLVYAETYNTLILDKNGFKNPIPGVTGLAPKENIKAWVDRKAFIHNLGHVAAAYYGFFRHPECTYLHEVLEDTQVFSFMRKVINQSACALIAEYPSVFLGLDLTEHIDDLTHRFMNKQLGDTVFRIGSDLKRKLGADDRVVGAINLARKHGFPYDHLVEVLIYGLLFRAKDESGNLFQGDVDFLKCVETDIESVLINICGFNKQSDISLLIIIREKYSLLLKSGGLAG
jgi:mannitol-1-phosphate 5-dehydrogenase